MIIEVDWSCVSMCVCVQCAWFVIFTLTIVHTANVWLIWVGMVGRSFFLSFFFLVCLFLFLCKFDPFKRFYFWPTHNISYSSMVLLYISNKYCSTPPHNLEAQKTCLRNEPTEKSWTLSLCYFSHIQLKSNLLRCQISEWAHCVALKCRKALSEHPFSAMLRDSIIYSYVVSGLFSGWLFEI